VAKSSVTSKNAASTCNTVQKKGFAADLVALSKCPIYRNAGEVTLLIYFYNAGTWHANGSTCQ